jgi:hypothetical protein
MKRSQWKFTVGEFTVGLAESALLHVGGLAAIPMDCSFIISAATLSLRIPVR